MPGSIAHPSSNKFGVPGISSSAVSELWMSVSAAVAVTMIRVRAKHAASTSRPVTSGYGFGKDHDRLPDVLASVKRLNQRSVATAITGVKRVASGCLWTARLNAPVPVEHHESRGGIIRVRCSPGGTGTVNTARRPIMADKPKPLKPDRPLACWVFSDKGKVRRSVEHPPRTQDELEVCIGRKFAGAMEHFHKVLLTDIDTDSDEPGDISFRDEDGTIGRIQVVEVVDPVLTVLKERRIEYQETIVSEYAEILESFRGCRLEFIDTGNEPYVPSVGRREGRECVRALATKLDALGSDIGSLAVGKLRARTWHIGRKKVRVSVVCERFADPAHDIPCGLSWGGGRSVDPGEHRLFLSATIRKKVEKCYRKPKDGPFWLLAYSSDVLCHQEDEDVVAATKLLTEAYHPFDSVWYFYPYDNRQLGHVVRLWPR